MPRTVRSENAMGESGRQMALAGAQKGLVNVRNPDRINEKARDSRELAFIWEISG